MFARRSLVALLAILVLCSRPALADPALASYADQDQIPAAFKTTAPAQVVAKPGRERITLTDLKHDLRDWLKSLRHDHYRKLVVEIPMRDGVKLHTLIVVPNAARNAPILLQRTPYGADQMLTSSPNLSLALPAMYDVASQRGYIVVIQDVRGKYRSGGAYVMARPAIGPLNRTGVDHATDAWDTIDWLVRHIPQSNRQVAMIGASYDGFTAQLAALNPHPALKATVVINPLIDGWRGDDWFHNGAFRQPMMQYIFDQEASRASRIRYRGVPRDDYARFLTAGSAGAAGQAVGLDQVGFWREIVKHPAYDAFWQAQAVDRLVAGAPHHAPTLYVANLWDQEDIYGAFAAYRAAAASRPGVDQLVIGPWHHDGAIENAKDGSGHRFRETVLQPFLDRNLAQIHKPAAPARVLAFETGANAWKSYSSWPPRCAAGATRLFLLAGHRAGFTPDATANADAYVSDPARPVPYRAGPIRPIYGPGSTWADWLSDDQRQVSARPDVLSYASPPLTAPLRLTGQPQVNLYAATSGTDADWVVKLIDVDPAGRQSPLAMDIFRGRYRESPSRAVPIRPGQTLAYRFALPNVSHEVLPGHRLMVQVQSSWFPLYDRNPQTFVPNIFFAKPADYVKATQRVFHGGATATNLELPTGC